MSDISPFIRYRDARAAIDWLQRAFGFEPLGVWDGDGGSVAHAELRAGDGIVQVSTLDEIGLSMKSPCDAGGSTMRIYLVVGDPDAHFERAKEASAEILQEPTTEATAARDYACRDLEGHLWSFGSYRPGHE